MPEKNLGVWAGPPGGKAPSINTSPIIDLTLDQIRLLSHDLNSDWTVINCVAYFIDEEHLSQSDYQVYEGMFDRAKANLQSTLTQLLVYLPQKDLLADIVRLVNQLEIQNLPLVTAELKPQVNELQLLLKKLLKQ